MVFSRLGCLTKCGASHQLPPAGHFSEREHPLWARRDWHERAFTVGIGGPVGSGKRLSSAECVGRYVWAVRVVGFCRDTGQRWLIIHGIPIEHIGIQKGSYQELN